MLSTPSRDLIIGLIDCNSFYCSCERLFRPDLKYKPVIVLSNNDGVTISRSAEAKALGIKMGEPYHLIAQKVKRYGIHVFSSNFSLYGDISARLMDVILSLVDNVEIYSIDEAFVDLTPYGDRANSYAHHIKERIYKLTGIPVSIGIGGTKVLAKVANHKAKSDTTGNRVFSLLDHTRIDENLRLFPVSDIWGIGRQSTKKLTSLGIHTAYDLKYSNPTKIQKILTIVGKKILDELNGIYSFHISDEIEDKKQIICSRSFGRPVFKIEELREAVSYYTTQACEKLRKQGSVCGKIHVFAHTNRHKSVEQYYQTGSIHPEYHTNSTNHLAKLANTVLESIFKLGIEYKKVGVILTDLQPEKEARNPLFLSPNSRLRDKNLMGVFDEINKKWGKNAIELASTGSEKDWIMRSSNLSPKYTTCWDDILKV